MTEFDDKFLADVAKAGERIQQTKKDQSTPPENFFTGFGKSAVSGLVEPFGFEPLEGVEKFKTENPGSGFVSEVIGFGVPYLGASKLAKTDKLADKIEAFAKTTDSPILGEVKKNLATFGPVEASKVASTAAVDPDKLGDSVAEAAVNLGIEAGFGVVAGGVKAFGKKRGKTTLPAELNLKDPVQFQYRQLKDLDLTKLDEGKKSAVKNAMSRMDTAIRSEELVTSGKNATQYIDPLVDGEARLLNRLFKLPSAAAKSDVVKRRFISSTKDFPDREAAKKAMDKAGITGNVDAVQFPRHISFKTDKAARNTQNQLRQSGLVSVGDNGFITQEKDGLFVIAKKIEGGQKAKAADEWVVFKTDDALRFFPDQKKFVEAVDARTALLREKPRKIDVENPLYVFDEASYLRESLPLTSYVDVSGSKNPLKKLGLEAPEGSGELKRRASEFAREYLVPTMFQFRSNPRANWIWNISRATYDKGKAISQGLIFGSRIGQEKNLFLQLLKNEKQIGKFLGKQPVSEAIRKLPDSDYAQFLKIWRDQLKPQQVTELFEKGEISKQLNDFVKQMDEVDQFIVKQLKDTQKAAGVKEFQHLDGHYMLSRTWEGTHRVPLYDEAGNLVFVAAGKTKRGAESKAEAIVDEARKEDALLKSGEASILDIDQDLAMAEQVRVGSPEFLTAQGILSKLRKDAAVPATFKRRTGVEGFKEDFTKDELIERMSAHTNRRFRYMSELSVNKQFESDLAKLATEDPQMFKELTQKLRALSGVQGELAQKQNQVVDKLLAPVIGGNSATKISGTLNKWLYHLQLGMLNMSFPVINATTFMQTVLPRTSLLMTADRDSLTKYFSWYPALGEDLRPRGGFGVIDQFKLMRQSMKEMGNPDENFRKLFERATSEGVVDPRFIEEAVGESSRRVTNLRGVLAGDEPYSRFIEETSSFLPGISEKWARGHAFSVGHVMGRDFFQMKDDALYRFAKEFTEQTMFNYGVADRARIMTAPMGSMFGLFKNWQAHYIGSMMDYVGEGVEKGNWNPLLWQMGGTASIGGMSALPVVPQVAEAFSQWADDKTYMEHVYGMFGGTDPNSATGGVSDAVMYGLPTFLGLSFSQQTAAPGADPARDASMLMSFVHWDRAKAMGQAIGKSFDSWATTGNHPIDSESVRDAWIKALAPKNIARAASVTEDRAVKSLNTGNPIIRDLNTAESMMYQMGFMPLRVARQHDVNEALWKEQKSMRDQVRSFGQAWAEAEQERDFDAMYQLQLSAMYKGIPLDSVIKSAKKRVANEQAEPLEVRFDPEDIFRFRKLGVVQ